MHDSKAAQSTIARWLELDGPFGDLFKRGDIGVQIITNIAPVAPETVVARLESELEGVPHNAPKRHQWVSLIKAIGYDADLFDTAVTILARFAAVEPENNNLGSARNIFSEFFHLYLSGTQAPPEQRRSVIKRLAISDDQDLRRSADIALRALLQTHFMSAGGHNFGARPRNWGWHPKGHKDVSDWFEEAIALAIELASDADARVLIAEHVRELWHYPACREALDRVSTAFLRKQPWIEGWIAFRATLRFDRKDMPEDVRAKLEQIIDRLKPSDLLNQARAVVLNRMPGGGGWDFADGEDDEGDASDALKKADKMAKEVGRRLARDAAIRAEFLAELLADPLAMRAYECGHGLAEGADDLDIIWLELATAYAAADSGTRDARVLGGFICEAHQRDQSFTSAALEAVIENPKLAPVLPYLQACIAIDEEGIARLRRAIAKGLLVAANFQWIANGSVSKSPPEALAALLDDIATLSDGVEIALDILHMHFYNNHQKTLEWNARLVSVGRDLLVRADFSKDSPLRDYGAATVISICLSSDEGRRAAEKVCGNICSALDAYHVFAHNLTSIFKALLKTQPFVTLDVFSYRLRRTGFTTGLTWISPWGHRLRTLIPRSCTRGLAVIPTYAIRCSESASPCSARKTTRNRTKCRRSSCRC